MALETRFWTKVRRGPTPDACWSWIGAQGNGGYGVLGRGRRGEGNLRAHRVSWEIHHGPIPHDMKVLHRCDNPQCANPRHLFLGTQKDNTDDMHAKGRGKKVAVPHGEANHAAKLTAHDVREIRAACSRRVPQRVITERYGVTQALVSEINRGLIWKTVPHGA